MKKSCLVLLAMLLMLAMAGTSFATDVNFSGHYRVRGMMNTHPDLRSDSTPPIDDSDAWMDHRFRIQPEFKVSDSLSLVTRFDGLDGSCGGIPQTRMYSISIVPTSTSIPNTENSTWAACRAVCSGPCSETRKRTRTV